MPSPRWGPTFVLQAMPGARYYPAPGARGARVTYSDPYIPTLRLNGHSLTSVDLNENAAIADCVVIVTDHKAFDYNALVDNAQLTLTPATL